MAPVSNVWGVAFNQMADNINALIASKKQLIDGIAHELRTPLVRLRYRLEMSENLTQPESQALNRDIGQLEALIEELLTYARLDRPQNELMLTEPDLPRLVQRAFAGCAEREPGTRRKPSYMCNRRLWRA
nr:sensor protein RstB [Salmonella sp. NCTC 7297]